MRYAFEPHPGSIFPGEFFCPKSSLRSLGILLTGCSGSSKSVLPSKQYSTGFLKILWPIWRSRGRLGMPPPPKKQFYTFFQAGRVLGEKKCQNCQNRFLTSKSVFFSVGFLALFQPDFSNCPPPNWDFKVFLAKSANFNQFSETQLKTYTFGSSTIFDLWGHFGGDFWPRGDFERFSAWKSQPPLFWIGL